MTPATGKVPKPAAFRFQRPDQLRQNRYEQLAWRPCSVPGDSHALERGCRHGAAIVDGSEWAGTDVGPLHIEESGQREASSDRQLAGSTTRDAERSAGSAMAVVVCCRRHLT
jgi:hypothetical protein